MKIEKYVVILTSNNGDKTHLKMSVNRDEYWVELHLADTVKKEGSVIYLFGNEIAKQELYQEKNDYKVRICAKDDIDVLLTVGDKNYVGSTGKTPKIRELQGRIDRQFKVNIRSEEGENATCEESKHCKNGRGFADVFRGEKSQDFLTIESGECVKNSVENDHCDFIKKKGENFVLEIGEIGDLQQKENERLTETKVDGESHVSTEKTDGQYNVTSSGVSPVNAQNSSQTQLEEKVTTSDESKIFSFDSVRFDGNNFYLSVKPQIDEIFVCYPEEVVLNNLVPNSRWVHIETPDGYYVVGLILDGDTVSYICYGVPSTDKNTPPTEIKDLAVWLSTGGNDGKGYWLIYQDALTGKCLK